MKTFLFAMVAIVCAGCHSTETAAADSRIRNQSKMDAYNAERNEIARTGAGNSLAIIEKMNADGSVDFKRLSDEASKNAKQQNKKLAALNEKYR